MKDRRNMRSVSQPCVRKPYFYQSLISVIFLLSLLSFGSCQDVKKSKQLSAIDKLLVTTDSIQKVWEIEQTDPVEEMISEVENVQSSIRKKTVLDTISVEFSQKLEDYKMIVNGLKFYLSNKEALTFGPKQVILTLNELKQDVQKATGDRSKYDEYISYERNKVLHLNVLLKMNVETKTNCVNSYQRLHEEMKVFSESR